MVKPKRILFISNGHGEDNNSASLIQALGKLCPTIDLGGLAIVGEGSAYKRVHVPLIGPTQPMPSGGFSYLNRLRLLQDIQSGLIGLTLAQIKALRTYAPSCDLVIATGDTVGQFFAYLSGRPFFSFISPLSSLYEGKLYVGPIINHILRSQRCQGIFTRDPYTAEDLQRQGLTKARFGGIPSLDDLVPTGKDLQLTSDCPMVALFPGSRLPEAVDNFRLQLQLVEEIVKIQPFPLAFRAALVPKVMAQLAEIARGAGWKHYFGVLTKGNAIIRCYDDAFADIICTCTLVLGMAGLAVDQSVAMGKPVIQIPGKGPQFTYRFAEAQERLLGSSVQTIGTQPANATIIKEAALCTIKTLQDQDYLATRPAYGQQRLGGTGASVRIVHHLLAYLKEVPIEDSLALDRLPSEIR